MPSSVVLRVVAGREDEFGRVRGWLDASAVMDAIIEATDEPARTRVRIVRPLPRALVAAYRKEPSPVASWARRLRTERAGT